MRRDSRYRQTPRSGGSIELTLAGLRETLSGEAEVLSSERPSGHFQRTFELPGEVDFDAGTAHLSDGLLVVTLPKD